VLGTLHHQSAAAVVEQADVGRLQEHPQDGVPLMPCVADGVEPAVLLPEPTGADVEVTGEGLGFEKVESLARSERGARADGLIEILPDAASWSLGSQEIPELFVDDLCPRVTHGSAFRIPANLAIMSMARASFALLVPLSARSS